MDRTKFAAIHYPILGLYPDHYVIFDKYDDCLVYCMEHGGQFVIEEIYGTIRDIKKINTEFKQYESLDDLLN